jgi:hypothetical protein
METAMSAQTGNRSLASFVLTLLVSAGAAQAPALVQKGAPPDFSSNNTAWVSIGTDWTAMPGSPSPVKQDPAYRYVPNNTGGQPTFRIADTNNPNLTEFAKASLKNTNDEVLAGKPMWSRSARCWATGVPGFLLTPAQPMYFIQTPRQVRILAQHDNDVRRIYLNVPHSEDVKPSWYGESVGHYEGDTLVVDTVGLNDKTFVDNFRTPHGEKLHVVERYRLIDGGNRLEVEVAMEDPAVFIKPLHVSHRWRRVLHQIEEWRCAAGESNNPFTFAHDIDPLPTAAKPDF